MNGQTVREHDVQAFDGTDAYTVPCPLCDAKVDELCCSELGKRNASPHNVRILAARAEIGKAADAVG